MTSPTIASTSSGATSVNPDDEIAATLAQLEAQAEAVCIVMEDYNAAVQAELNAEVMVLERALRAVSPMRRSLCKPVVSEDYLWNDEGHDCSTKHFPQHGVELSGGWLIQGDPDDPQINCMGSSLVLWADGTLGELGYAAEWLTDVGGTVRLECTAEPVTTRQALQKWNLEELLAKLTAALKEQAEHVDPAEKERAIARAARLTAVAGLAR